MIDDALLNAAVKEAVQQVSVWVPFLSGLGGAAILGMVAFLLARQNHSYTLDREEKAADKRQLHAQKLEEDKRHKELIYISTELIIILEQYAEDCEWVNEPNRQAERAPKSSYPVPLNYETVTGDWRSLPPDHSELFRARQDEFSLLRLKAIHLSRQLRRACGLPSSRLNASSWSAQPVMMRVLLRERKQRRCKPEGDVLTL
ncbi:hypothetical protein [Enterobacter sp.]|uniref:hypothetical protein n=1 Tax=Enterobacter sp. TaxID=42895 RepID=UPI00296F7A3B|nr:hypothetical protein [Enterobacter sp.]